MLLKNINKRNMLLFYKAILNLYFQGRSGSLEAIILWEVSLLLSNHLKIWFLESLINWKMLSRLYTNSENLIDFSQK